MVLFQELKLKYNNDDLEEVFLQLIGGNAMNNFLTVLKKELLDIFRDRKDYTIHNIASNNIISCNV